MTHPVVWPLHHLPLLAVRSLTDRDVRTGFAPLAAELRAAHAGRLFVPPDAWSVWVTRNAATWDWVARYATALADEHRFRFFVDNAAEPSDFQFLRSRPRWLDDDRRWVDWPAAAGVTLPQDTRTRRVVAYRLAYARTVVGRGDDPVWTFRAPPPLETWGNLILAA